jgi:hypothetical protein
VDRADAELSRNARRVAARAGLAALLLLLQTAVTHAQGPPRTPDRVGFLTGPSSLEPEEVARGYLQQRRSELGLAAGDLDELTVSDRYTSPAIATTHIYLRQQLDGIDVKGSLAVAAVRPDGRLVGLSQRFARGLRTARRPRAPLLDAATAVMRAAEQLGLSVTESLEVRSALRGRARAGALSGGGVSTHEIPVHLAWLPESPGELRLVWNLVIRPAGGLHWWSLDVDAETGELLQKHDWVRNDGYNVHAFPLESPESAPRSLEADPADGLASPYGWHDTNGFPGAESNLTRGNNVSAQEDADGNDLFGFQPDGGLSRVFDFPLDLSGPPSGYRDASITQLFYLSNVLHDLFFRYGFDAPAGNFQQTNYGAGGLGGDAVQADAQDAANLNNASFATPPDGQAPRLQVYLWNRASGPSVRVTAPDWLAGPYPAGTAEFGPAVDGSGLAGNVVLALDAADANGPSTSDACSPLSNGLAIAGNLALIDRGDCLFVDKVRNAQDALAAGVIIVNNAGEDLVTMAGSDPTITIPALFLGQTDGNTLRAQLASGVQATLIDLQLRDAALDTGVVAHEYTHGVSTRLTGGPSTVSCLTAAQPNGMGEGWSDFFALALTARAADLPADVRGFANYLVAEPRSGPGIRNFRYSTSQAVNPLSYADIATLNQPHGVGEVWATALWDAYWNLVAIHGFDPDLILGSGGNNLAMQLVIDGLKLQPCNPSFLEGRDAILLADLNRTGGQNRCALWAAFAGRGMGADADDGGDPNQLGDSNSLSPTEGFELPELECALVDSDSDGVPDDGDASGVVGDAPCAPGQQVACDDSCPFRANPGQADTGGVGTGAAPDGIGDACQCGDVTGGGIVNTGDLAMYTNWIGTAGSTPGFDTSKCDVGTPGCDTADLARLRSALGGNLAAIEQACTAARPE